MIRSGDDFEIPLSLCAFIYTQLTDEYIMCVKHWYMCILLAIGVDFLHNGSTKRNEPLSKVDYIIQLASP